MPLSAKHQSLVSRFEQSFLKNGASSGTASLFRDVIYGYYKKHGRHDLPWRHTRDPFHVLVSEVMLQQTQVERVIDKYHQFLAEFPDIPSLAGAPLKKIFGVWQGLGYNRRALSLKKMAQKITLDFPDCRLPHSVDVLLTLPGIGIATASAVAAFAFNKPSLCIETNIRRVFLYFFFRDRKHVHDREIIPLLETSLDRENPRKWYYALMDYGAMLKKTVENPNRASRHYQKQPRFEGSDRQIRGAILKTLLQKGGMNEKRLLNLVSVPRYRGKLLLDRLIQEGFLKKHRGIFRLA